MIKLKLSLKQFLSKIQIKRRKEVVTGNLEPGDSFGEKSVIKNEPLEHSIISETHLILATIGMDDLEGTP